MERDYADAFEPLRYVHLEDSWVLEVRPSESAVAFRLDLVLTEGHPDHRGARPGEHYDYRPSDLLITGERVEVELSGAPAAVDADGLRDLGNIDAWRTGEDGWSLLHGEWGRVRVLSPQVRLTVGPREQVPSSAVSDADRNARGPSGHDPAFDASRAPDLRA